MPEIFAELQSLKAVATIIILLAAVFSFVKEKISPALTSLLAILALLLTGVLTPVTAFAGFSHPATISVAAVLVLSAGIEKTGAMSLIARKILTPFAHSELLLTAVIMLTIGFLSAFINNTAAVAVFIPVVLEVCRRSKTSPGRVLMPMSHAATIGGMCTLIGTSTNLVAHEYARSVGLSGFSMFELGKIGVPMLIVGYVYMLFVGRHFLPRNESTNLSATNKNEKYLAELIIKEESSWIGREINVSKFLRDYDVEQTEVVRQERELDLSEKIHRYAAFDSLRVRGALDSIFKLWSEGGLDFYRPNLPEINFTAGEKQIFNLSTDKTEAENELQHAQKKLVRLAEVVVLTASGLIGHTLRDARFAERFDSIVLALRRRGFPRGRPSSTPLRAGDVLVVEGTGEALDALSERQGFLVIGNLPLPKQQSGKVLITLLTLVGVVTAVSLGIMPIVTAAVAGCAVLIFTKCLKLREVYQAIDMSVIFLLAGSLALGAALEETGITTLLADSLTGLSTTVHPYLIVAAFLFSAIIISEFMSNSGTVPLLAPVAIAVANKTGIEPMALMAAITYGSTAAFAMPIGYQTSLMIFGVGGYHVKDFARMGIVLDILLAILALLLIPYFWQLTK